MKRKNKCIVASLISLTLAQSAYAAQYVYDDLNRLSKVVFQNNIIIEYHYDIAGNLLNVTTNGLPTTYTISGQVINSQGQPLSDVLINIGEHTTVSDQNGYYFLTDIAAGDYTLFSKKEQYSFTPQPITIGENQPQVINITSDSPVECLLFATHDQKIRDSQFFTLDPTQGFFVEFLGPLHLAKDIEALDISPKNDEMNEKIYAASGDDAISPGMLYILNAHTGELYPINSTGTGFNGINGLSFHPDGSLWAWAEGDGLIHINPSTGLGSMVYSSDRKIEDLTWDNTGEILYVIEGNQLLAYSSQTKELVEFNCQLPGGHIEALEYLPDDRILFAIHEDVSISIHALEPNTCQIQDAKISTLIDNKKIKLDDVEGIAWPFNACSSN